MKTSYLRLARSYLCDTTSHINRSCKIFCTQSGVLHFKANPNSSADPILKPQQQEQSNKEVSYTIKELISLLQATAAHRWTYRDTNASRWPRSTRNLPWRNRHTKGQLTTRRKTCSFSKQSPRSLNHFSLVHLVTDFRSSALGLGCQGQDEHRYIYELHPEFNALPTMPVVWNASPHDVKSFGKAPKAGKSKKAEKKEGEVEWGMFGKAACLLKLLTVWKP